MPVRVGINGFGRIGRNVFRAGLAAKADIEWVAVNDITDNATLAHLLKYDSILGRLPYSVSSTDEEIVVDGKGFKGLAVRDPAELPWKDLGVDVVLESTGLFTKRDAAAKHLDAGAKKVLISAPATGEDLTVVKGVNDSAYDGHRINDTELGCALPYKWRDKPPPRVQVRNTDNGKTAFVDVVDVGPWNTDDKAYVLGDARPQAESGTDTTGRITNLAGIDLTPGAAKAIGLAGKGNVSWAFVKMPTGEV
jgi:predicted dinucleotide-utilizing enzyme